MSVSVLVSGELFRDPERKTSQQSGKTYVRATIKTAGADDATEYWSVLCFSETVSDELMELHAGERLAVQGQLKLELYQGKISRTIFAGSVLTLRRKRTDKTKPKETKTAPNGGRPEPPPFDDPISF
jgi:single-stranded DNA-binding protein